MSTVELDKKWGAVVEHQWASWLKARIPNVEVTHAPDMKHPGWDLYTKVPTGRRRFYEVKWDASAQAPWKDYRGNTRDATGNLFIEYENPKMGRKSGIEASYAHYWVYVMKMAYELVEMDQVHKYKVQALILDKDLLKDFTAKGSYRVVDTKRDTQEGQVNARGKLVPISDILADKESSGLRMKVDFTEYIRPLFL